RTTKGGFRSAERRVEPGPKCESRLTFEARDVNWTAGPRASRVAFAAARPAHRGGEHEDLEQDPRSIAPSGAAVADAVRSTAREDALTHLTLHILRALHAAH